MSRPPLNREALRLALKEKMTEAAAEPSKYWADGFTSYLTGPDGAPEVRVGLANFDPRLDIWASLRGPSRAGRHPIGPEDIWNHYAANNNPADQVRRIGQHDGHARRLRRGSKTVQPGGRPGRNAALQPGGPGPATPIKSSGGDQDPYDYYPKAAKELIGLIEPGHGQNELRPDGARPGGDTDDHGRRPSGDRQLPERIPERDFPRPLQQQLAP